MPKDTGIAARQRWMAILARAAIADIRALLAELPALPTPALPAYEILRGPETGMVMLRGRAGGSGAPFNLGEATVARCSVRTGTGQVGHAWRLGGDHEAVELAAALDAAMQDPLRAPALERAVLSPLAQRQAADRDRIARQAAATRVQFFTLATMRT